MNPLVETAVQQWLADGLQPLFPDDVGDLIELAKLADAVTQERPSPEYLAMLEPEVHVGGKVLRRLSIGASDFFAERPDRWFADDPDWLLRSLFYVLAEGRAPGALWAHETAAAWKEHLRRWFRGVDCTWRAAGRAVEQFLAIERATDVEDQKASSGRSDRGWLVELLWHEYGKDERFWCWECPRSTVQLLWNNLLARKEAERRASGDRFARDPDGSATRTLFKFRDAEEALTRKMRERKNHG